MIELLQLLQGLMEALGLRTEPVNRTVGQVLLRGVVLYFFALVIFRLAPKRTLGQHTPFDQVLLVVVAASLSAAINEDGVFVPTIAMAAVLVAVHVAIAAWAARSRRVGTAVRGKTYDLVKDGEVEKDRLREHHVVEQDIKEAMHQQGEDYDPKRIERAWLERDGAITVKPKKEPKVLEIRVEHGVQTVRLQME